MNAIEASDLSFRYRAATRDSSFAAALLRRTDALRSISFSHAEGEFLAVMGPTGAGKSSVLRCLNGAIPRFFKGDLRGRLSVFGRAPADRPVAQNAADVGIVFQDFELQMFTTTVMHEVAFGLENLALPRDEMHRRVAEALAAVGLEEYDRREPATLSGGEKQRLAIACVLAMQPRLIALDEPTTDLDPLGKTRVVEILESIRGEGRTVVLVEHEPEELRPAHRMMLLADGEIREFGKPADLLSQPERLASLGLRPPAVEQVLHGLKLEPLALDGAGTTLRSSASLRSTSPDAMLDAACRAIEDAGLMVSPDRHAEIVRRAEAERRAPGDPILEVRGLIHTFPTADGARELRAVDGVGLTIHQGEILALLGPNGAGKTTLAAHLNGLLRPAEGEVRLAGKPIANRSVADLGRQVGYVFQNPDDQIFSATVEEEIAFALHNCYSAKHERGDLSEKEIGRRVGEVMEKLGLSGLREEDPFILTKGDRQRVAVASVLASEPGVIILDEPTTGLDHGEQQRLMQLLIELNRAGHTIVLITHSMVIAAEYAHRVVVMAEGKILADGPTREVFAHPDVLARASLRAPEITRLGSRLGLNVLTPSELSPECFVPRR